MLRTGWVAVVDDDEVARAHAQACLVRLGWSVLSFPDGESFMLAVRHEPPEAALLDIFLPKASGLALTMRVRTNAHTAGMRLVAYTDLQQTPRDGLIHAGFDDAINKPATPEDFAQRFIFGVRSSRREFTPR